MEDEPFLARIALHISPARHSQSQYLWIWIHGNCLYDVPLISHIWGCFHGTFRQSIDPKSSITMSYWSNNIPSYLGDPLCMAVC